MREASRTMIGTLIHERLTSTTRQSVRANLEMDPHSLYGVMIQFCPLLLTDTHTRADLYSQAEVPIETPWPRAYAHSILMQVIPWW